jgi:hypothetical protein
MVSGQSIVMVDLKSNQSYLSQTMGYLLQSLKSKERSDAFITIGLISIAVDGNIKPYLPKIMEIVRASLPNKVYFKINGV